MYSETVQIEIPKKYRKIGASNVIGWAECVFGRRQMPNGYEVSLCGVEYDGRLFLGAAARAPHDLMRDSLKGYGLAMGRARSSAFRVIFGLIPRSHTLVSDLDNVFFDGILPITAAHETSATLVDHWCAIAAQNAEEHAIQLEINRIMARHGHRYQIAYALKGVPEEVIF